MSAGNVDALRCGFVEWLLFVRGLLNGVHAYCMHLDVICVGAIGQSNQMKSTCCLDDEPISISEPALAEWSATASRKHRPTEEEEEEEEEEINARHRAASRTLRRPLRRAPQTHCALWVWGGAAPAKWAARSVKPMFSRLFSQLLSSLDPRTGREVIQKKMTLPRINYIPRTGEKCAPWFKCG